MEDERRPEGSILVVEDSRTQAEYLGHILGKGNYHFRIAENGRHALDLIAEEKPALVLTDIVMPGIDGYELCRRIRQDKATADIPVIMVTQLFDPADVLKGLEAGADNFIIKPFDSAMVLIRIREVFSAAEQGGEPTASAPLLDVEFGGSRYSIRAGRLQILRILLSTYELAIRKNTELQEAQEHLLSLNEQLQQMVEELQVANDDLQMENTSRQQAEHDLAQANKKLQLMTSITRHDLLNQLTVLQGYMELADENNRTKPDLASAQIKKSLDVIKRSINTVQFTSEYQRIGMTSLSWHPLSACIVNASRYAALGEVRLENEVPAGVEIYADPLIEKAIFNLIDNALRYGLTLTTIRFRIEYQGDTPVIICEDDGIGIRPENKERIFTYGYGTNTGMGLFLVREILGITGIGIRESGEPKKGARFEIRVPPEAYRVT